jgi:hypothetical protein
MTQVLQGASLAYSLPPLIWSSHLTPEEDENVPRGKHMRGVGPKEQRQYEHIKESAEKSGRYGSRAKEVAARTVMKEHKQKGHAKGK